MQQPTLLEQPATGTEDKPATIADGQYNLLHEPLITVSHQGRTLKSTLQEVCADLANDKVDDLPFLRPHQRHFWHATLCQIGAIVMVNAKITDPPKTPEGWLEIIQEFTREEFPGDEPWNLVTSDITKPAFLQPPATTPAKAKEFSKTLETPDEMDLPVGSKHHDIRESNIRRATPELWLFALVARQTGGGYDGPKLYGVSRMNSGTGNRHGFSLAPSTRWGPHVIRDLCVLAREYQDADAKSLLLWTRPWDGTMQEEIPIQTLNPKALYVEISRRIRLERDPEGNLSGRYATSQGNRVRAKESKGMTEDPWTITETDKAVTVGAAGFGYRQVARFLDPEKYTLPKLAKPGPTDDTKSSMHLVARAVARGNGKTEGYHEEAVFLRSKAAGMLGRSNGRAVLHGIARQRIDIIAEVQSILGHAVKTYLQNGDSGGQTKKEHQRVIGNARDRLNQAIERDFWQHLQDELESRDQDKKRGEWCHGYLIPTARTILASVCRSGLSKHLDRYKATTEAEDLFGRRLASSKKLPSRTEQEEIS